MIAPQVHVPYQRIGEYLSFIKEQRINLEIYFSAESIDSLKISDLSNLAAELDYNPVLTMHAPFMDLSPGAVDLQVRAVTVNRFNQIFEIAQILQPKGIVFHSGYEKWKYAMRVDLWLKNSLQTWEYFAKRSVGMGIKIAIENIFEDEPTNLRLLMEEMGSEYFGLCFDAGHFNLFSRIPLGEWLDQISRYIIELHLHDNNRTFDDHKAIGDGTFDFKTLFSAVKDKKPIYTIEGHTKEAVLKSIEALQRYTINADTDENMAG
jgi:sugar phosphate isomerase/epimerase